MKRNMQSMIEDVQEMTNEEVQRGLKSALASHAKDREQGFRGDVDRIYVYRSELARRGLPSTESELGY